MLVRCLHCHEPIELVDDSDLRHVACSSCGGSFNLVGEDTLSWSAETMRQLGPFELIQPVGGGAFGTVWKARDTRLDRIVAIKVPRKGQLNAEESEQFLREARHAAQLKHPSIVAVHEVGRDNETVYIVSDFVHGVTLDDWLTGHTPSPREAAQLCVEIAQALQHAHGAGIIHRDLKPGNVMLDKEGHPFLMDFGLSRREMGEVTMTVDGQILGTPAYMSPEQAEGKGHEADRRSDVYSLGVILFRMLTVELPFRGSAQMIMHQKQCDDAPSLRRLNTRVPRDLDTICLKCLEREPRKRYQTARAMADDLRRWLDGQPIQARPILRTARAWRWCKRNPVVTALTMAVATVLLSGVVVSSYYAIKATEQASIAKQVLTELERQSYALLMVAAFQAWETANPERAKELLHEARAKEPSSHHPDLAWRFLWERCQEGLPQTLDVGNKSQCVAYAPDGRLAVGLVSGEVVLHDFGSDKMVTLPMPFQRTALQGTIECLTFTPDGLHLLAGGSQADDSGILYLWDLSTVQPPVTVLPVKHPACVLDIAVSSDGRLAASVSADKVVSLPAPSARTSFKVWNVPQGTIVWERELPVRLKQAQVAFVSHPTAMLIGTGDKQLHFWDVASGEEILTVPVENADGLLSFALSPDARSLVTAYHGVRKFDLMPLGAVRRDQFTWRRCDTVTFSHDGKLVAARDRDTSKIIIWFRESGREFARLSGGYETPSDFGVADLTFSPDSRKIVLGRDSVKIWDLSQWYERGLAQGLGVAEIVASPDRKTLLVAVREGGVAEMTQFTLPSGASDKRFGILRALSSDRTRFVTETDDRLLHLWHLNTGQRLMTFPDTCRPPVSLSPDGQFIAVNGTDSTISVWDSNSGELIAWRTYTGRLEDRSGLSPADVLGGPQTLALTSGGDQLVSAINVGNNQVKVELWHTRPDTIHLLDSYNSAFVGVLFSPASDRVLVTPAYPEVRSGNARVWDVSVPEPYKLSEFHSPHRLMKVCFSEDGRMLLLSGRAPGDLILHDIVDNKVFPFNRSSGEWVYDLQLSADGRTLVTTSLSGQIKFWRMPTGEELGTVSSEEVLVLTRLAWDDEMLITGSYDGVRFWPITPLTKIP